jgi:hypothetical protein
VYGQHLTWFGTFDIDASAGGIASTEALSKGFALGMVVQPRSAVELCLYLENFTRFDVQSGDIVGACLKVEYVSRGMFHRSSSVLLE